MTKDSLLAALWIKSQLGLDARAVDDGILTSVGCFRCIRSKDHTLLISGPGLDDEMSQDRSLALNSLIEYLIEHGDSIVISPPEIRDARILKLSDDYMVDPKFIRTVIADGRRVRDRQYD